MLQKSFTATLLSGLILLSGCQLSSQSDQATRAVQNSSRTAAGISSAGAKNGSGQTVSGEPAKEADDASFVLAASGDVLSHISNTEAARQTDGTYDYMPQLTAIGGLLSDADYTMVNLEAPVSGKAFGYRGFPRFNAPVSLARTLKELGVDLVATANNHAMDNGWAGLTGNLNNLDQIGLDHVGTYRTEEEAGQAFIRDINGIRVGFIASTYGTNHIPVPNDFGVSRNTARRMRAYIAQARKQGAELIVYHVHWGKEYTDYPSQVQMDVYQVLEEEGVDVVIGSHPHRLQPMELRKIEYEGKKKNQAVIWSTANLLQGQSKGRDYINTGAVFQIKVERKDGRIEVGAPTAQLIYCLKWKGKDGKENYKVIPEEDMEDYERDFPEQYEAMRREFQWAKKTLSKTVDVVYSDGTTPK